MFSDNSQHQVSVTQSHKLGDEFPLGLTQVNYTAADEAGNINTCIIEILVQGRLF